MPAETSGEHVHVLCRSQLCALCHDREGDNFISEVRTVQNFDT